MIDFKNLDSGQLLVVGKAMSWYREHLHHVVGLVKNQFVGYPPSGSDLFRPELWTSAHWKWFTDIYILHMVEE